MNTSFNESKARPQNVQIQNHFAIAGLFSVVAALTTLAVGWVSLNIVNNYHEPQVRALLRSELTAGKDRLESYLHEAARGLSNVAAAHVSQPVLADFEVGFHELGENAEVELQRAYITDNPNPIGRKQELLFSPDNSLYSRVHEKYHGWFKQLLDTHDFYDIFLVSARGDIIYSVFKESDFATNLNTGAFRDTELSSTFKKIEEHPVPNSTVFSDFVEYQPSNFEPAAFIGTPITSNGEFRGALIAQIKSAPINSIMQFSRRLGRTGKTYIVGSDRMLRSNPRLDIEKGMLQTDARSSSVDAALDKKAGIHTSLGVRKTPVLAAYAPFTWNKVTWAVVAEVDQAEVNAPINRLRTQIAICGILCAIAAFVLGWLLAERKSIPLLSVGDMDLAR